MSTALLFGGVASAATEHCPSGGTKTEGTHNGVVLSAGTQFCVKASNEATTVLVADGSKSLIEYVLGAGIVNGQGKAHDVSYYVVYPATTTTTEVPPSDTTSTTTSPTTPTTEPPSSSTTVVVTTTPAPESTSTLLPTTSLPQPDTTQTPGTAPTPTSPTELPETGSSNWTLAAIGGMLIGSGSALTKLARRRR
jgi:LPXTG-motif cell wall-anchored protein